MRRQGIEGPWAAGERILVLIAGDAMATSLVRAGRRLADLMNAPWTVANVERPNRPSRDPHAARRVTEALKLAEQLGASTVVLTGDDLPDTVLAYAGRNNVTQIVIGKAKESLWRILLGRSLAQALMRRSGGAALHFVSGGAPDAVEPVLETAPHRAPRWRGYLGGARRWWCWPTVSPFRSTGSPPAPTWR